MWSFDFTILSSVHACVTGMRIKSRGRMLAMRLVVGGVMTLVVAANTFLRDFSGKFL